MKRITWEDFKTGNVVVHCDTIDKALHFMSMCHSKGIHWNKHENAYDTRWKKYTDDTCYRYDIFGKTLLYGPLNFYKEEDYYKIYNYEIDLIQDEIKSEEIEQNEWTLQDARIKYFTKSPSCIACKFSKNNSGVYVNELMCDVKFANINTEVAKTCEFYTIKF